MGAFLHYWQEPDLEPNQKSMVEHFCKNNLLVIALDRLFSFGRQNKGCRLRQTGRCLIL